MGGNSDTVLAHGSVTGVAPSVPCDTAIAPAAAMVGYHPDMPKLLLNLRDVPDDEADEVRALLAEQKIAFYETEPNFWGVSGGGIWIKRDEDVAAAKELLAEYQLRRRARARAEYRAAEHAGTATTLWASVRENPLRALVVVLGLVFFVALLLAPFVMLAG